MGCIAVPTDQGTNAFKAGQCLVIDKSSDRQRIATSDHNNRLGCIAVPAEQGQLS